ncbi:uncharacterized protein LY79DRAFT_584693 [Colletotrichum navitas]|uniref:Uncharacterized protein n=1 Tax=Colletotrichum navitas TaxID=681940 RepID=A0AAD8UWE6_9PEZI|nr:uncharacterized protein LY79DRAFT_584693 [Colletotrichum navitas]KAK1569475.1 hypothetical protein LY79DRAFT_584693 [Colletotrichum navitas]
MQVLSRATSALRSRLAFEASLPHGDPQVGTQKSDEVALVTPTPQAPPQGVLGGRSSVNTSVGAVSFGLAPSSTAVAVVNEGQVAAIRSAIDALVGGSLPAEQLPAYQLLMDQYAALMRGSGR